MPSQISDMNANFEISYNWLMAEKVSEIEKTKNILVQIWDIKWARYCLFLSIGVFIGCCGLTSIALLIPTDDIPELAESVPPTSTAVESTKESMLVPPSATLSPSNTPTEYPTTTPTMTNTPLSAIELTHTAQSSNSTGTAISIQATQTTIAGQSTATRQAYYDNLTSTAAYLPSGITFLEIENNYYDMDDAEWYKYRKSLVGEIVLWTGEVLDKVGDALFLDMGQYAFDRMIVLHKVHSITVNRLEIGASVTFIAVILDVTPYCDIQLNLIDMQ